MLHISATNASIVGDTRKFYYSKVLRMPTMQIEEKLSIFPGNSGNKTKLSRLPPFEFTMRFLFCEVCRDPEILE